MVDMVKMQMQQGQEAHLKLLKKKSSKIVLI